jgi:eukaryotic-like serine/threonine-protein kinase
LLVGSEAIIPANMTLVSGSKLGPYEIAGPLGAGGMGEVYRARDTRLNRTVAIKILPAQFTADAEARQRFEREAKTISGLNHPHICVLYDVGHQDGADYLVMECLEGETLGNRLEKGPLPLEQVLKNGAQIADALDKAHRSGIVHRDLKPGNVMLTATGAKLLDFGLAKETSALGSLATVTATSPMTPVTQQGTIVGTFQYMSPEQVEGKQIDGRSDIFSLGAVLYEMLTGKRAFEGRTQLSVASAILEKEPEPIRALKPMTPPTLERAIQRCLAKDPEERWQAARDLAIELNWIGRNGSQEKTPTKWKQLGPGLGWMLCGALVVSLLAGALWWRNTKAAQQTMVFSAPLPFAARDLAIGPNGHTVAVVGYQEDQKKSVIWLYEVGSEEAKSLAGTEGGNFPFWSPDGKSLGFFADGKLKRLDLPGGPLQVLCDAPSGRGGTWNKDGVIVFTPRGVLRSALYRVSASGGTPTKIGGKLPGNGEASQRYPMFLPDGKHYLFLSATIAKRSEGDGIYVGSLDSDEYRLVVKTSANGAYAAPGYLLYLRDRAILAQRFDAKRLQLTGEPMTVASEPQFLPRILRATFAASDAGMLLVQKGGNVMVSRLIWYDRGGKEAGTVGEPEVYANPHVAANGKAVAVDKTDVTSQNTHVWTYDLPRGAAKRLTFYPGMDAMPVWSPDGTKVVFASSRSNVFNLYLKETNGAQEEKVICESDVDKYPNAWSRDGKTILYEEGPDLKYLTLPEMKSTLFLKAPATLKNAQFSPDGKWVAYASNETSRWEVYVTSFPEGRGKWQVSAGGGEQPRWRRDGTELFYVSPDAKIMAVPLTAGGGIDPGVPVALFQTNPKELLATSEQFIYDVDSSGQRFLVNTKVPSAYTQPITVVLNWGKRD